MARKCECIALVGVPVSDALAVNAARETALIRYHCQDYGWRRYIEFVEVFPEECRVVIEALEQVFDHEEAARVQPLGVAERLVYHQHSSGPIRNGLKCGVTECNGPGAAWPPLDRFTVPC
jgi:transposase